MGVASIFEATHWSSSAASQIQRLDQVAHRTISFPIVALHVFTFSSLSSFLKFTLPVWSSQLFNGLMPVVKNGCSDSVLLLSPRQPPTLRLFICEQPQAPDRQP
jgi:hypothetical protein